MEEAKEAEVGEYGEKGNGERRPKRGNHSVSIYS